MVFRVLFWQQWLQECKNRISMFECDTWYSNSEKTIWSGFQHLICYKCIASVVLIGFFCINIIPILNLIMFCNWFHKKMVFWGGRGRKVYLNEGEGKRKRGAGGGGSGNG